MAAGEDDPEDPDPEDLPSGHDLKLHTAPRTSALRGLHLQKQQSGSISGEDVYIDVEGEVLLLTTPEGTYRSAKHWTSTLFFRERVHFVKTQPGLQ